jgi:D-psicose/D-tagatose/L-ribulose 3-epimerase
MSDVTTWKMPSIGVISMTYARPFRAEHFPLFARMKAVGMEFVELLAPEPGEFDATEAGTALRRVGLGALLTARVNLQRDLASADAEVRADGVAYLCHCVDMAVAIGAPTVGGPLYGTPLVFAGRAPAPIDAAARAARIAHVVEGLRQVGRYATERGVMMAIEPLNRYETDFCNTAEQVVELVRLVDSPAIRLMLDTFHMNMEDDDLPQAIRLAGAGMVHFQANENHRGFLGTGHIDFLPICRALAEIRYSGTITLEPFRRTDRSLSVPLAQWRPPTHDEDLDLRRSAELLRGMLHAAGAR